MRARPEDMMTLRPSVDEHTGEITLETRRTITQAQGSWRWQIRLRTATYRAVYSPRVRAWLWKVDKWGYSLSFSGGNWRNGRIVVGHGAHNCRLTALELCALATVRGEG